MKFGTVSKGQAIPDKRQNRPRDHTPLDDIEVGDMIPVTIETIKKARSFISSVHRYAKKDGKEFVHRIIKDKPPGFVEVRFWRQK